MSNDKLSKERLLAKLTVEDVELRSFIGRPDERYRVGASMTPS